MRSLLMIHRFAPHLGGVQQYLHEICRHAAPGSIRVLTEPAPGAERFDPLQSFPVDRAPFFAGSRLVRPGWLPALFSAGRICRRQRISLIQLGILHEMGLVGPVLKAWIGVPYIVYTYGLDIRVLGNSWLRRWMRRMILGRADHLVGVSGYVKEQLESLGVSQDKITVAHPGVDIVRFRPGLDSDTLRRRYGLEKRKIILSAGRLVTRKGHEIILQSLPEMIRKIPSLTYLVIGEGPERSRLEGLSRKLGLESHVRFGGAVPEEELPLHYNLCDLFALLPRDIPESGDVEGFGMVYLEASACGKAVIGSDCGGVKEAIVNRETGFIIPQNDPSAFAEAAFSLLLDPEAARQMGKKGHWRAVEHFSWPKTVSRLEAVWEKVARKG